MSNPIKSPASAATERIISLTNHLKDSLNPVDDIQKAKMSTSYKFQGWMGLDKDSVKGKMVWQEYEPKTWTEDDVDIKITHCGICVSIREKSFSYSGQFHDLSSAQVSILPKTIFIKQLLTPYREATCVMVLGSLSEGQW